MSQNVITERQMFEAVIAMTGRSTSKDASGDYEDDLVRAYWYGWKLRADVERAREEISALNGMAQITAIFDHIDEVETTVNEKWIRTGFPQVRSTNLGVITGGKK